MLSQVVFAFPCCLILGGWVWKLHKPPFVPRIFQFDTHGGVPGQRENRVPVYPDLGERRGSSGERDLLCEALFAVHRLRFRPPIRAACAFPIGPVDVKSGDQPAPRAPAWLKGRGQGRTHQSKSMTPHPLVLAGSVGPVSLHGMIIVERFSW
eukprot:COSAG01_NODE_2435_length_7701_cov_7.604709_1_plen_152_part_00